jgi:hypothetical protein
MNLFPRRWRPLVLAAGLGLIPCFGAAQPGAPVAPVAPHWPNLEGGGAYVLFMANNVTIVNGSRLDYERGKLVRKGPAEELFWFLHAGREMVIRDPATVKQIEALIDPLMKIGQQQAAVAAKQASYAQQQESLNGELEQLAERQAEFAERMNQLAMEQVRLQEAAEDSGAVEAEMRGLEEEQSRLEQPQGDFARQQDEITRQVDLLAHQQEELTHKLEKATQDTEKQLRALVSQAVAKGIARPPA